MVNHTKSESLLMATYKATAAISFTFQFDGAPGQAKAKADEMVANLIYETNEENLTLSVNVEKVEQNPSVLRLREYPVEKVLELVPDQWEGDHFKRVFTVNKVKYTVKITSDRYRLFKKNRKCVACGLEGTKLFLEKQVGNFEDLGQAHFNLYGEENGKLVLMTKDHIKAKAFGGSDSLSNFQTMCETCNGLKASYSLDIQGVGMLREVYKKKGEIPKNDLKKELQKTRLLCLTALNGQ